MVSYAGWINGFSSVDYSGVAIGTYLVQRFERVDWRVLNVSLAAIDDPLVRAATGVNLYGRSGGQLLGLSVGITEWDVADAFLSVYAATPFSIADREMLFGLELEAHRNYGEPGGLALAYFGMPLLK